VPWLVFWDAARLAVHGIARDVDWIPKSTGQFLGETVASVAGSRWLLVIFVSLAALSFIDFAAIRSFVSKASPLSKRTQIWLRFEWQNGILFAWIIAPLVAAYLISISIHPILVARYLICSLPGFLLLVAAGLRSITITSRHSNVAIGVALILIIAIHLPGLKASTLAGWRDDFRTAMKEFSLRYKPSDRVIVLCTDGPMQYYYRKPILEARIHCSIADSIYDDINTDRFWLIYYAGWSKFNKELDMSRLLARAERDHDVIYSFQSPTENGLEALLFQRRVTMQ
jgi:hypothetical protein